MRRLYVAALLSSALSAGCNSILDIPERALLVDDDTGAADTQLPVDSTTDTAAPDTATLDTTIEDSADASLDDSATDDATESDTLVTDDGADAVDSAPEDSGTDSAVPDTADTSTPDTTVADTAVADTGADASAPTCGVTGKPCCGAPTLGMCDTNSVCASGTCIAAAGSCVRASDCGGVCTGPSICAGNVCFTCGAAAGAGALWSACTSSAQCANGPCDRIRGECSSACAPGITGDADCTAIDPKAVCTAPNITVTSGPTMATGYTGVCARGCKRDGDCATGETCRLANNSLMNRLDLTCNPAPGSGTVDVGGACTTSSQCMRGVCLTVGGTSQCTPLCTTNADCPTSGTWKSCNPYTYSKPGGGTQIVYACGT